MTATIDNAAERAPEAVPSASRALDGLTVRILDALLREDHLGILTRGSLTADPASWTAPLPGGRTLVLPVRDDGYLADIGLAAPFLTVRDAEGAEATPSTLDAILDALAPEDDPEAEAGWDDFREECRQSGRIVAMHETESADIASHLAAAAGASGPGAPAPRGFAGLLVHEAAAAVRDHPVHPNGRTRWGLSDDEVRAYAPEYLPEFELAWTLVTRSEVRSSEALRGGLPAWWPTAAQFGADEGEHVVLPVHPLTVARGEVAVLACPAIPGLRVAPTLSTRTVALLDSPSVHLKLPLPTASLGRRNRRTIKPGSLAGGETMQRILEDVLAREPELAPRVLLADESRWADSASDLLAVLVREYPSTIEEDLLAPAAALLAPAPGDPGVRVLDTFAAEAGLGSEAWIEEYAALLLDWHVALWLRYGIALEAHQQNITVAQGPAGLRLVYKDNDSGRIDCARASAALGRPVRAEDFSDARIAAQDPTELADMFTTITLHLCIAAMVVEAGGTDAEARAAMFARVRARLEDACERWTDPSDAGSLAAAALLRERVLEAERLPIKGMLTAGTLLPKERLGCSDVNKFYFRTGPNYLAPSAARPGAAAQTGTRAGAR
ncbi:IucA/IucC family protein [Sinomonas sp. B1-1]|uniref:IucA/IucC family protein n=1 Tax=Sinomonas sp. B1-1 TaxID=3141454 RepID=UPI003D285D7E